MYFDHGIAAPVLRRLDWRYLIPTPPTFTFDRITLIGADHQLCDAVVAIGLAKEVSTALGEHNADLVAVLSPAPWYQDKSSTQYALAGRSTSRSIAGKGVVAA